MSKNLNLNKAKAVKNDEFYTQYEDVEKELVYYKKHLKGKVVYCNCDRPVSNFVKYFIDNFHDLGLKELIFTHYENPTSTVSTYNGVTVTKSSLTGNGSFKSNECITLLQKADIVVTNPPFSLFREYLAQLIQYNKKFLIIGNVNAVINKDIFPLIKDNKIWMGASIKSGDREFQVPDDYPLEAAGCRIDENNKKFIRVKGVRWFTNLDYKKHYEDLLLYETYTSEKYLKYMNYNAINIDKTKEIPKDYYGEMGVPITFLDKHNPNQFDIITRLGEQKFKLEDVYIIKDGKITDKVKKSVDGSWLPFDGYLEKGLYDKKTGQQYKRIYDRIIIKRK